MMFDFSGYYHRMARQLPDDCKIAEIGIANGDSALYLAGRLHDLEKKFKLYMVDDFSYGQYIQMKTVYQNIIKSGLGEYIEVVPKESLVAVNDFNDGYLDLVFVDSSHLYEQTKQEIHAWYKKVKDGGILSGHDFFSPEVNKAVLETIPYSITRDDIPDREFEPEDFLHTESTDHNYGVWWCKKDFYKKLM